MPFLLRGGCRIAYTKSPALWGRHADVVYLPGVSLQSLVCIVPGAFCMSNKAGFACALSKATPPGACTLASAAHVLLRPRAAVAGMASTMHGWAGRRPLICPPDASKAPSCVGCLLRLRTDLPVCADNATSFGRTALHTCYVCSPWPAVA